MATTTAVKQREQARVAYDAFLAACPSRQLFDRLSDKWVGLVLCALGGGTAGPGAAGSGVPGPLSWSQLARALAGVSPKMLTQTLRSLERDGLVSRSVTPTVPVTVTYEATALGLSLHTMVRGMKNWAETHMDDVLAARAEHDARDLPGSAP
jgi:DNA-binding HxlR family transcriptional regulator